MSVIRDGQPVTSVDFRSMRIDIADVLVTAREQGIKRTADIEYAVLEADGRLSFFTRDSPEEGAPEPPPVEETS